MQELFDDLLHPRRVQMPCIWLSYGLSGTKMKANWYASFFHQNGPSPLSARRMASGSRRVGFGPSDSEAMRSLSTGRGSIRVRSRGLPRNRGTDKKCGIMTVTIRRLLVVSGAGEWPATALSPALGVGVSIALPTEHLCVPPSAQHTKSAHRALPRCGRLSVCAPCRRRACGAVSIGVCAYHTATGQPCRGCIIQLFFSGYKFRAQQNASAGCSASWREGSRPET